MGNEEIDFTDYKKKITKIIEKHIDFKQIWADYLEIGQTFVGKSINQLHKLIYYLLLRL